MKVAFTYNLRLTDVRETEKEAEYDSAETVNAIAQALEAAGHEVEKVEVSSPASNLLERLEAIDPDTLADLYERKDWAPSMTLDQIGPTLVGGP